MSRRHLSCLPVALVVLLLSVALGWLIVRLVTPDHPSDPIATQTPIVIVIDPTRPVVLPPTVTMMPTPEPTEAIIRPTSTPRATETPSPTATPPPEPTRKPPEQMEQKG